MTVFSEGAGEKTAIKPADISNMSAESLLQLALKQIGAETPTSQTILRVAVKLAEAANRLPNMAGRAKLDLVLKTLRDVLAVPEVAARIPEDARGPLKTVIDTIVPEALTLVIEAGRGQYDLKKPSVGCLARLCGLMCRRAGARVGGGVGEALVAAAAKVEEMAPAPAAPPLVAVKVEDVVGVAEEKPPAPADATVPSAAGVSPPPAPFEPRPEVPTPAVEKI